MELATHREGDEIILSGPAPLSLHPIESCCEEHTNEHCSVSLTVSSVQLTGVPPLSGVFCMTP